MTTLVEKPIKANYVKDFDEETIKWLLKNGFEPKSWSYNSAPYYEKGLLKIEPYESVFAPKRFYDATIRFAYHSHDEEADDNMFATLDKNYKQAVKDLKRFIKFANQKGE